MQEKQTSWEEKKLEEERRRIELNTPTRDVLDRWRKDLAVGGLQKDAEASRLEVLDKEAKKIKDHLTKPPARQGISRSQTAPVLVNWDKQDEIEGAKPEEPTEVTDLTGINAESDDDELTSPFEKKDKEKDKPTEPRPFRTTTEPPKVTPGKQTEERGRAVTELQEVKGVKEWKLRREAGRRKESSAENVIETVEAYYDGIWKKVEEAEAEKKNHTEAKLLKKEKGNGQKKPKLPLIPKLLSRTDLSKSDGDLLRREKVQKEPTSPRGGRRDGGLEEQKPTSPRGGRRKGGSKDKQKEEPTSPRGGRRGDSQVSAVIGQLSTSPTLTRWAERIAQEPGSAGKGGRGGKSSESAAGNQSTKNGKSGGIGYF